VAALSHSLLLWSGWKRQLVVAGIATLVLITALSLISCGGAIGPSSNGTNAGTDPAPSPLTITTTSLPNGQVNGAYSATAAAAGGTAPYTWSIYLGVLPAGISLASNTGVISGTPTVSGTFNAVLTVQDAQKNSARAGFSIAIAAGTGLQITTTSLPSVTSGTAYSDTLTASGGQSPYKWSFASGVLPAGMTLSSAGVLSGIPSQSGTFSFTVSATDSETTPLVATQALSLLIQGPLSITTTSLANATSGTAYSATLTASGGQSPYKWSLASGTLPTGLTLSSAGVLSGTPSQSGTFSFAVSAADSEATPLVAVQSLSLLINAPLSITTTSLPNGTTGTAYSTTLAATGGQSPYKWSLASGTLPTGLTLSSSGALAGTPTQSGTFPFTVSAADSEGTPLVASQALSLVVQAAVSITTTSLPNGTSGTAYSTSLTASGGTPPYTWSISSGALPAGISLASNTGVISGTPSVSGTFNVTLGVQDAQGNSAMRSYSITIAVLVALQITTASLPNGVEGVAYDATVAASGGTPPYTWSLASGFLPSTVALAATTGSISGTPTVSGTFSPTVQVTDSGNNTASRSYSIAISGSTGTTSGCGTGTDNTLCGNYGQPYLGTNWPPSSQCGSNATGQGFSCYVTVNSCGTAPVKNTYYLLTGNVGSDPTQACVNASAWNNGTWVFDLGGYTITGYINIGGSGTGLEILNGSLNCTTSYGCVYQSWNNAVTTPIRVHHLTVTQNTQNAALLFLSIVVTADSNYCSGATGLGNCLRVDHITGTASTTSDSSHRGLGLYVVAGNSDGGSDGLGVEQDDNAITCPALSANCQGISAIFSPYAYFHNNQVIMAQTDGSFGDGGRAILCDGEGKTYPNLLCYVYNNDITVNVNRAVRLRHIQGGAVYNNIFRTITTGGGVYPGAVHYGNSSWVEKTTADVYNNIFQLSGAGNGVIYDGAYGWKVYNNSFTCPGGSCTGFAVLTQMDTTFNNNIVSASRTAGCVVTATVNDAALGSAENYSSVGIPTTAHVSVTNASNSSYNVAAANGTIISAGNGTIQYLQAGCSGADSSGTTGKLQVTYDETGQTVASMIAYSNTFDSGTPAKPYGVCGVGTPGLSCLVSSYEAVNTTGFVDNTALVTYGGTVSQCQDCATAP